MRRPAMLAASDEVVRLTIKRSQLRSNLWSLSLPALQVKLAKSLDQNIPSTTDYKITNRLARRCFSGFRSSKRWAEPTPSF
jgi:hypothetical protein